MTAVHVITRENRGLYHDHLEAYFRLRHDIFVGERGWGGLRRSDGRDVDRYDNDKSIYLLAIDQDRVVGGQRLYPTVVPHMISEVFPHLATRGIPVAGNIYEWTRYFVVKERRMGRTDCRLLAGLQQFCLSEGITEVTAVVELWWLPRWQQSGFKVRPLGLPVNVEGQACIASAVEISHDGLESVRRLGGLRGSCLVRQGLLSPVLDRVSYAA